MHGVCEPAFLAHLFHQARGKPAAADNVVQNVGRDEIVITPWNAAKAELRDRLRHVHLDDFPRRPKRRFGLDDFAQV